MTRAHLRLRSGIAVPTLAIDGTSELRGRVRAAACLECQIGAAKPRDLIGPLLSAEEGAPS
jgi:hypothetical protein